MTPLELSLDLGVPFATVLGLLLIFRREWIAPLAVGVAFAAGYYCVQRRLPSFPPASAQPWLLYVSLLSGAVLTGVVTDRLASRLFMLVVVSIAVFGLLFQTFIARWSWEQSATHLGVICLIVVVWYVLTTSLLLKHTDIVTLLSILIGLAAAAAVVGMNEVISYGRMAGGLASITAAVLLVTLIMRSPNLTIASFSTVAVLHIALLALGTIIEKIPVLQTSLILTVPIFAWIGVSPPLQKLTGWKSKLVRLLLVMIPAGVAVGLAMPTFLKNMKGELY